MGQQSERRGQGGGVGVVYRRDNKQARPSGTQASAGVNVVKKTAKGEEKGAEERKGHHR